MGALDWRPYMPLRITTNDDRRFVSATRFGFGSPLDAGDGLSDRDSVGERSGRPRQPGRVCVPPSGQTAVRCSYMIG